MGHASSRSVPAFLQGGGEMGERIRAFDWPATPLGAPEDWPGTLKHAASLLLASKAQIVLFWGPEFRTIYNDAYIPTLGRKHPWALGQPASDCWKEVWPSFLGPTFAEIVHSGEAFSAKAVPFLIERYGFPEETYFDVSYDPVRADDGLVAAIYCIVSEVTGQVLGERRLALLRDLGSGVTAQNRQVIAARALRALESDSADIPFAAIYLSGPDGAHPAGAFGA